MPNYKSLFVCSLIASLSLLGDNFGHDPLCNSAVACQDPKIDSQPKPSTAPSPPVPSKADAEKGPVIPGLNSETRDLEAEVESKADPKVKLSGTLAIPKGDSKHPAVILIGDYGPLDRDGTVGKHRPMKWISDYLVSKGFATIRYDGPGVGKSTGKADPRSLDEIAQEALQWIRYAKSSPSIDANRIAILGFGEGGAVATLLGNWEPSIAAIVLLASPGCTGSELLEQQLVRDSELQGGDQEKLAAALEMRKRVHDLLTSGIRWEDPIVPVREIVASYWDRVQGHSESESEPKTTEDSDKTEIDKVSAILAEYAKPALQRFLTYDPAASLMVWNKPVLALWGELDSQVVAEPNMERLVGAVERSGNPNALLAIIPGANHLFQKSNTGSREEVDRLESKFDERLMPLIEEWLNQNCSGTVRAVR